MPSKTNKTTFTDELEQMISRATYHKTSGSVFYSTKKTLIPGIYYFLGLNPGGTPIEDNENQWIINNLFPLEDQNAYFEEWTPYAAGKHPYQMNVKAFLASLNFPDDDYKAHKDDKDLTEQDVFIKSICCSNLSFLRSNSINNPKRNIKYLIDWNVHKYIINSIIHPSVIIINGMIGYNIFKNMLVGKKIEIEVPTGITHKNKERVIKITKVEDEKLLVGIPHLSWPQHAICTDNKQWRKYGLIRLLNQIDEVLEVREPDGCQWCFDMQKIARKQDYEK